MDARGGNELEIKGVELEEDLLCSASLCPHGCFLSVQAAVEQVARASLSLSLFLQHRKKRWAAVSHFLLSEGRKQVGDLI